MQEATACIELKHRNLINVHEFGISKSGAPFMIMEYLEGQPLTSLIEKQGHLELPQFINIFTQICDGLQFAHERGIVHRDVKPSNIMVTAGEGGVETAKVLDFGIAKLRAETDQKHLTPTGNVLGSPAYIAPEQCAGEKASPSIDVYALGCVMYEALCGHPPFVHESVIKMLLLQLSEPAPALSTVCKEGTVPPALEYIIMRCLEKDPAARYLSASELDAELWEFAYLYSRGEDPQGTEEPALQLVDESLGPPVLPPAVNHSPAAVSASPVLQAPPAVAQAGAQSMSPPVERAQVHLAIRIRKCRSTSEMDGAWEGLNLAIKVISRNLPLTIFIDTEAVVLLVRPDVSASKFGLDVQVVRKISAMQGMLQQLIKSGAQVLASERWAKRGTEPGEIMPGVRLLNDDEICDLIINSRGSIVDY
jgi:serine/threonine protein kinase